MSPDGNFMWTGSEWIPAPPDSSLNQVTKNVALSPQNSGTGANNPSPDTNSCSFCGSQLYPGWNKCGSCQQKLPVENTVSNTWVSLDANHQTLAIMSNQSQTQALKKIKIYRVLGYLSAFISFGVYFVLFQTGINQSGYWTTAGVGILFWAESVISLLIFLTIYSFTVDAIFYRKKEKLIWSN